MQACFTDKKADASIPITVLKSGDYPGWLEQQDAFTKNWLATTQYKYESGSITMLPEASGKFVRALLTISDSKNFWPVGGLANLLPDGDYYLDGNPANEGLLALAWGLGAYQFSAYKKPTRNPSRLYIDKKNENVYSFTNAIYLVRDLINTPTDDMGPQQLANAVDELAKKFNAKVTHTVGDDLLKNNYAGIYTVGRASDDAPRLIDMRWGDANHPKLTLVGKGVCFDSGGLDLKSSANMLLMKKDMGGAAICLGLAHLIMEMKLPVSLRVLIPAVENSVSGNAYRPGDIIKSRKGLTIEVGNTDAEGRVVLADALTEAVSEQPELLIDISTLTGAARVALGTDLPAMFCNNDSVAADVIKHGEAQADPVWRMPLFSAYRESLNSPNADINNNSSDVYGGAITAALFLKEFVPDTIPWMHFDLMAWNLKSRPGRPQGGEAMALRALFSYISQRFATS
jgi:leucyl aminopeptidase